MATPVVVWFTGMNQKEVSHTEKIFCQKLGETFFNKHVETFVYAVPPKINPQAWAPYEERKDINYDATCQTKGNLDDMLAVTASAAIKALNVLAENKDNKVIFGGTSNGCIPAYYLAQKYAPQVHVYGCVLHNGCPSMSDEDINRGKRIYDDPFPVLMLLGTWDYYWNKHWELYKVAWRLGASVLSIRNGSHTTLPHGKDAGKALLAAYHAYHAFQENDNSQQSPVSNSHRKSKKRFQSRSRSRQHRTPPVLNMGMFSHPA